MATITNLGYDLHLWHQMWNWCRDWQEFFYLLQLPMQVGVSPSSLRQLEVGVRETILKYQQQQQSTLGQSQKVIEVCAAADETAFEQDVLVLMDLSSGYILLEEEGENRQYQTWLDKAQRALTQVGVRVRSLVSDRAPALIKLALEGFECLAQCRSISSPLGLE